MNGRTPAAILILTLALMAVGLTMVYSASANKASGITRARLKQVDPQAYEKFDRYHGTRYLERQTAYAIVGLVALLTMSLFDHHHLRKLAPWILGASFLLLCLVFAPGIGITANNARRWIGYGSLRFQPSELAKLAMIIYMARMLVDRERYLDSFLKGVLPACVVTGLFCLLIILEPDFSSTAVLGMIVFIMWFVGGMRIRHLAALCAMAIPVAALGIVSSPYRLDRIRQWIEYLLHGPGGDMQMSQSVIAVGSGGLHGLGLGRSVMKYYYLPEAHTDFIFAVVGEELGFIRAALILFAFLALIMLGWRVALKASDSFGGLLAAGITTMFGLSVTINLLVVLGVFPTTGLVLPFLSYGGSSMLIYCASIGILINVAKYNEQTDSASAKGRKPTRRAASRTRRK